MRLSRLRPHWSRPRLPGRTVRSRLTLLYAGLSLFSGAVVLTIAGLLWGRTTNGPYQVSAKIPIRILHLVVPQKSAITAVPSARLPAPRPPGFLVAQAREVAGQLRVVAAEQHSSDLHHLLLYSGVALAIVALLSVVLSWLSAGRVLAPLRTITAAARTISASNLHERLALAGPEDELKELGDTFDQLLARLDRSFQSQRLFVANASHELRTPLATMRATLDVALAKPGPIPEQTVALALRLERELDQVDQLLEGFLSLARAQRGPVQEEVPLSLDDLVTASLERRAGAIAEARLEVRQERCEGAWVAGNETLLARMVENVIDNAVRHNQPGGWVRAASEAGESSARLVVENGGAVLGAEEVHELVQPFRRHGAARTGSDSGFGLGLSIVQAVAETHGGRLELTALPTGGLRVLLELPRTVAILAGSPA